MDTRCFSIDDLGGGKFRHTIGLKPTQINLGAGWTDIVNNFAAGDVNFPQVVTGAPMLVYVAADGMRRICPTHDPTKYFEIGAPYIKPAGTWNKVSLGACTRTANKLSWSTAQADVNIYHGGHSLKLEIPLKGGWQPPNGQVAFPIGLTGLTRVGTDIYDGSNLVMHMQSPIVYDADNTTDTRPIASTLAKVGSQWYVLFTLPSLTGMTSPVIDPTLTLQPDATAGKDTVLSLAAPTKNYGTLDVLPQLILGSFATMLLRFDLSSIPASAVCNSATLTMYVPTAPGAARTWHQSWYSLSAANAAWIEGTKNYAVAGAGEPCWNALAADGAGGVTTAWAGSAGAATSGTDFEASLLGTMTGDRADAQGTAYSTLLTASRVQGWFGASNTNYGLRGVCDTNVNGLASSDLATAGYRPKLVVDYTLPSVAGFRSLLGVGI